MRSIDVTAEDGTQVTLRVPVDISKARSGTPVTDEYRERMSRALSGATAGTAYGWKSPFTMLVQTMDQATVLSDAVQWFQADQAQIVRNGIWFQVSSRGYQAW